MKKQNHKNKRWRLLADLPIQGGLLIRVLVYWCLFQIAGVGTIAMMGFILDGNSLSVGQTIAPSVVASLFMLPFVMLDMVIFSNKFTGPMVNLKHRFAELTEGKTGREIKLRPGDFYREIGASFNHIRNQLNELRESAISRNEKKLETEVVDDRNCHVI